MSRRQPADSRRWLLAAAAAAALGLLILAFYLPVYWLQRLSLPIGFDAPWYIWRAEFAAEQRLGPLGTAARPGHALVSALLGGVSGFSQIELASILPVVLVVVFALALGALSWAGLGPDRARWAVVIAIGGTVLGTTRLPGENVSNLLNLCLIVAAVTFLCRWVCGDPGLLGAVVLLVAAGLAHWLFLAVSGAVLLLAALLAAPSSIADRRSGRAVVRTEAGALLAVSGCVAAIMTLTISSVLRAPFATFEGNQDPRRFIPKLRNDLLRLPFLAPFAVIGGAALVEDARGGEPSPGAAARPSFVLRLLGAWTAVCVAGVAYGALTRRLPPHRFLALLVAVPGTLSLAAAVMFLRRRVAGRTGDANVAVRVTTAVATAVAVVAIAVPGALAWYRHGPGQWMEDSTFRQASTAAAYLRSAPEGHPVVFVISPSGRAGPLSAVLKERTVRAALPPERMADAYFFVGDVSDLLAGRRTLFDGTDMNRTALRYWQDVRTVLDDRPVALVLESVAGASFSRAFDDGDATLVGPNVAVLRGRVVTTFPANGSTDATREGSIAAGTEVPGTAESLLKSFVVLLLLYVGGAGWSVGLLGRRSDPEVLVGLAPAAGLAVLMIAALGANLAGAPLHRPVSLLVYAAVTLAGIGWGWSRRDATPGVEPSRAPSVTVAG